MLEWVEEPLSISLMVVFINLSSKFSQNMSPVVASEWLNAPYRCTLYVELDDIVFGAEYGRFTE